MKRLCMALWVGLMCGALWAHTPGDSSRTQIPDAHRVQLNECLSSSHRELNLAISPDGKTVIIASDRGGNDWNTAFVTPDRDTLYDVDLWVSNWKGDSWTTPKPLPFGINSSASEDEPVLSKSGNRLHFLSWNLTWEGTAGPYYRSKNKKGGWSPIVSSALIPEYLIRDVQNTRHLYISSDDRQAFWTAGLVPDLTADIYSCKKSRWGWTQWQKHELSTFGEERSAFLSADGRFLYFSSDGYEGYGGLDLFCAQLDKDGHVTCIQNMGPEINTSGDEHNWVMSRDGSKALFIRDDSIYEVSCNSMLTDSNDYTP
ncbi:hypothetical protein [Pontibacter sp. G13]|uniref:hypothetical protein n=1 Tax=Pontibacter sp. G13 TaxID=3074898 RepID=UPI00288C2F69|nr:hypothetical protein [Pontibacter sp. G13]WNJ19346.1 hypothetical protein RJD25_02540 [Pontibacter sp. G13]